MKADHLEFRYVTDNEVASLPIIWDEFKLLRVLGKGGERHCSLARERRRI